jgi:hypothetical protein
LRQKKFSRNLFLRNPLRWKKFSLPLQSLWWKWFLSPNLLRQRKFSLSRQSLW